MTADPSRAVTPLAVAIGAFGLAFGVLARTAGLSAPVALLISAVVLAGGSQFAFVGVLAAGGDPWAGAVSGLLLNLRFVAMGAAMARRLPGGSWARRLLDSYLSFDEPVMLGLAAHDDAAGTALLRRAGWTFAATWMLGTAVGALGAGLLDDPGRFGLDAAFPAGFLVLLWPRLDSRRAIGLALLGGAVALVTTPVLPPGLPVALAALVAVPAAFLGKGETTVEGETAWVSREAHEPIVAHDGHVHDDHGHDDHGHVHDDDGRDGNRFDADRPDDHGHDDDAKDWS